MVTSRVCQPSTKVSDAARLPLISIEMGWLEEGESKTATWKVRLNGVDSAKAEISVLSTRGGVDRREVVLR